MEGPRDRLTTLDWNLQDIILSKIPFKDLVSAALLSRAWRHKWMQVSRLVLEDLDQEGGDRYKLVETVYWALKSHMGDLNEFEFKCHSPYDPIVFDSIHYWFIHLQRYPGLKALKIQFDSIFPSIFAATFANYKELRILTLAYVGLYMDLEEDITFGNIVSLSLSDCACAEQDISRIISSCPKLRDLFLFNLNGNTLDIDSPSLTKLTLKGSGFTNLLMSTPNIQEFNLHGNLEQFTVATYFPQANRVRVQVINDLVQGTAADYLSNLRVFETCGVFLKFLDGESVWGNYHRLVHLQLDPLDFYDPLEMSATISVLLHCVNLESLVIKGSVTNDGSSHQLPDDLVAQLEDCQFPVLQTVRISITTTQPQGEVPEQGEDKTYTELIRVILARATALQKIYINNTSMDIKSERRLSEQLRCFVPGRASVNAIMNYN